MFTDFMAALPIEDIPSHFSMFAAYLMFIAGLLLINGVSRTKSAGLNGASPYDQPQRWASFYPEPHLEARRENGLSSH